MDYNVWLKYREDIKTLEHFNENIDTQLHPTTTNAYKKDIFRAIDNICYGLRTELVLKKEVK